MADAWAALNEECQNLRAELAEARKDGERWRWLVRVFQFPYVSITSSAWKGALHRKMCVAADMGWREGAEVAMAQINRVIDAAMAEGGENG